MLAIVDRLEEGYVVIELDGDMVDVPKKEVAGDVKAGDVVEKVDGIWRTNKGETKKRTAKIKQLMDEVWED
ncbi:DUF3006 domain-containing protein [Paenibacillus larvae]